MVGETRDSFSICSEVPGHSRCKKKIEGGNCPSCKEGLSDSCKGHHRSDAADLQQALQWRRANKDQQTQTAGFV